MYVYAYLCCVVPFCSTSLDKHKIEKTKSDVIIYMSDYSGCHSRASPVTLAPQFSQLVSLCDIQSSHLNFWSHSQ